MVSKKESKLEILEKWNPSTEDKEFMSIHFSRCMVYHKNKRLSKNCSACGKAFNYGDLICFSGRHNKTFYCKSCYNIKYIDVKD
jgi:hypothetical protein